MRDPKHLDRVYQRIKRTLGTWRIADVTPKVRAIVGAAIPKGEEKAQQAWTKLGGGIWPEADEMAALEIVMRLLRPAPLSLSGALQDLPEDPSHPVFSPDIKQQWGAFQRKIKPVLYSIGRIELAKNGELVGTGFLIDDGVLATNRHVLDELTMGTDMLPAGRARVCFQAESRSDNAKIDPSQTIPIDGYIDFHPTLDIALLSVPKLGRPAIAVDPVPAKEGDWVVVIGYPAMDSIRNPAFIDSVFGNPSTLGLKRAAVGETLGNSQTPFLYHDCSTLGGNSGSPVFSLLTGTAVGIHFGGFFRYRNEAHDGVALRDGISWIRQR